jgi:poly(3-hydroxybutyrate) depolymerase
MILKLVTLICLASASAAKYSDCDASDFHEIGNFGKADFHSEIMNSTTFYSVLPADTTRPVPLVVFMHGSTGQWEFYNDNLSILASHGAAVVFPFVKSPEADKHFWTTNTDGTYLVKAIEYAREMNENPEHAFYGRIDTDNIVIAGHSMGATCSINASNKLLGDEAIKLTIALHPGICGPFGKFLVTVLATALISFANPPLRPPAVPVVLEEGDACRYIRTSPRDRHDRHQR